MRPISCEAPILPATHGSALFTRGQTQALGVVTLGTIGEAQMIDTMLGTQQGSLGRAERPDQGPHVQDPLPAGRRGGRGFRGLRHVGGEDPAVVVETEKHHLGR